MKFISRPIEEHIDVPLADDGQLEELVSKWKRRETASAPHEVPQNDCYVVSVSVGKRPVPAARLAEITSLVKTQGDSVVGSETRSILKPNPKMLLGVGVARELGERAVADGANMVVIDAELSPSQTRNLEDAIGLPICDREAVILNVFQRHARTRRARIQVEIAHLEYLRPRIRGIGLDMDQQAGGIVGARGSGETASELLARQLDGRLVILRKAAKKLGEATERQRRGRAGCERIALVGYTNAGKSSLMNRLTAAGVSAADRPFETLDATTRMLSRHGGDVLLSDTVGFIRDLPERLLASFESTLEEIREASLVCVVIDISDVESTLHRETTESLLERLGAGRTPRLYALNKADRLSPSERERATALYPANETLVVSAHSSSDVARLRHALLSAARQDQIRATMLLPYGASDAIGMAYSQCRVLEVTSREDGLLFTVEADVGVVEKMRALGRVARSGGQQ